MIKVLNLNKSYNSNKKVEFNALSNISFELPNTGLVFIVGKSGSGKSTLLNLLGGLDKYDSGDIIVNGKSTREFKNCDFDAYRNTYIGFVFQEFNLLEEYTVEKNIRLALELQGKIENTELLIKDILDKVELYDKKEHKINEISGGQKQRVAIARALVKNPDVILADEPTGNLDSETGKQIMDTLKMLSKEKLVVMITHDTEYAKEYADRVIELKDGKILCDSTFNKLDYSSKDNYRLIKSRLPILDIFKFSLNNIANRVHRLFFATLVMTLAVFMFGVSFTFTQIDFGKSASMELNRQGYQMIEFQKNRFDYTREYNLYNDSEFKNLKSLVGENAIQIANLDDTRYYSALTMKPNKQTIEYPITNIRRAIMISDIDKVNYFNGLINGRLPISNLEVLVTDVIAYSMISDNLKFVHITSLDDVLGQTINERVTIVGIIDTGFDNVRLDFKSIIEHINRTDSCSVYTDYSMERCFPSTFTSGTKARVFEYLNRANVNESLIFTNDGFAKNMINLKSNYSNLWDLVHIETIELNTKSVEQLEVYSYRGFDAQIHFIESGKQLLENGEIILPKKTIENYFDIEINSIYDIPQNASLTVNFKDSTIKKFNIVGYIDIDSTIPSKDKNYTFAGAIFSESDYTNYINLPLVKAGYLLSSDNDSDARILNKLRTFGVIFNSNSIIESVNKVVSAWEDDFLPVGKYVVAFLGLFATLLVFWSITGSIVQEKRKIGILRALGAKGSDISKIYLLQSLIFTTISAVIAILMLFVLIPGVDSVLSDIAGTSILKVNIFTITFIILSSWIIGIIASFIPAIRLSKMLPIDSMENK